MATAPATSQVNPATGMYPTAPAVPKPTPISKIPGVSLTATNPANDLRGQTIAPGATADRFGIANQQLQNWNATTAPQFQSDLRGATSNAAATGRLGSGGLRTSLGDLTYNRDVQRQGQQNNFLTNALTGSIDDAYKNVGIAQQQQGYQTGLQNQTFQQGLAAQNQADSQYNNLFNQNLAQTQQANATQAQQFGQGVTQQQLQASLQGQGFNQDLASQQQANASQAQQFGQGVTEAQLGDSLTNSSSNRALQQLLAGSSGDPSSTYLGLAGMYGNNASQGMQNVGSLIGNTQAKNTATANGNNSLEAILAQYGLLPNKTATATPNGVGSSLYPGTSGLYQTDSGD